MALMVAVMGWLAGCSAGSSDNSALALHLKNDESALLQKSWSETPIPFYISNNVPERLVAPILDSFARWEDAAGRSLFVYLGRTEITEAAFEGKNVVVWHDGHSPQGHLGDTYIRYTNDTRAILEADIVIHESPDLYEDLQCAHGEAFCRVAVNKFDMGTVMTHEIGHVLGYVHTEEEHAIMNPQFGMNDVIHGIDEEVISELLDVYAPALVAQR